MTGIRRNSIDLNTENNWKEMIKQIEKVEKRQYLNSKETTMEVKKWLDKINRQTNKQTNKGK